MRKRESHTKSRKGCQNCKRRHVKCDEQGPPCANCTARKIEDTCCYPNNSLPPIPPQTNPPQDVVSVISGPSPPISTPVSSSVSSDTRRLLELELMNRWSTTTYKSFYSVQEDTHYLQTEIPRGALKHEFLLNGLFSISALEISMCEKDVDSGLYACAALEYYDKASESFREELNNVTQENHHYLFLFSSMAAAINMAIPQSIRVGQEHPQSSMLERIIVLFDLLHASISIAELNWILLFESPLGASMFSALSLMEKTKLEPLDEGTEESFTRLRTFIEYMEKEEAISDETSVFLKSYPTAVKQLHYLFRQDATNPINGLFSVFPELAGKDFTFAVKAYEPMALYILMHWGVLMEIQTIKHWWVESVGKNLVLEVSETLIGVGSNLAWMPEWSEGISWARAQVGLEAFSCDQTRVFAIEEGV